MTLFPDTDHQAAGHSRPARTSSLEHVLTGAGPSTGPRWRPGERLQDLFEVACDEMAARGRRAVPAAETSATTVPYDELDAAANRLARLLLDHGARAGDRIALLLNEAVPSYVAMLAVLKVHAAYVPLDQGFPQDRLAFIVRDCGARLVLSLAELRPRCEELPAAVICLDEVGLELAALPGGRLTEGERGAPADELAYVIYTSGTTGRPKGVAVEHASICNFLRVAAEVYGMREGDRVYQGMTIAFDFSVEEIWVPLLCGATLVPRPPGPPLIGAELADFLRDRRVTALCCVPTLLATLEEDLPDLRFLLVSGEACPQDLVRRWHRPGRRFLNVYGPTEATVTATWSVVHPERPVTLGVPLPTYSTVILDPASPAALPHGSLGEIGIAGPGLARGYVNRDDLTEAAFIPDFLGIPGNPTSRIYRTGDLGRVNADGAVEYHGRIDTQVKVRGYRIELGEVESVLLQEPAVAQAAVTTHAAAPGLLDLVAYYTLRRDAAPVDAAALHERLRAALPAYMVPAHLERLERMPMLPSNKVDRGSLPAPTGPRAGADGRAHVAPASHSEKVLAEALADVLGLDRVSVDSSFFEDLGASSLLLSRFCGRVDTRAGLPPVTMRAVYQHPCVRSLAAHLDAAVPGPAPAEDAGVDVPPAPARAGTRSYVVCAVLQLAVFFAYAEVLAWSLTLAYGWLTAAVGAADVYLRALVLAVALFGLTMVVPVLAKWLLVGRWTETAVPVWTLRYLRVWTVRTLLRANPIQLFVGTPLYPLYLRALGAEVGRRVTVLSRTVPVATDLLRIGDDTVIRKDCSFSGCRVDDGVLRAGPVQLGRGVLVGEGTVLDLHTGMGDGAVLGHASSLQSGQVVPAGSTWHGSPAEPTGADYRTVPPRPCGTGRRRAYPTVKAFLVLGVYGPVGLVVSFVVLPRLDLVQPLGPAGRGSLVALVGASLVAYLGLLLVALVTGLTVPRLLRPLLPAGVVFPLYGLRYSAQRTVERLTNSRTFMTLFGDSSAIVQYLQVLGYDLSQVEQTGSNFGVAQKHATPYLTEVGTGTMVADGLSMVNADFSSTSFVLRRASIGPGCFLGNSIVYPAQSRTGRNVLFGTKAMVPVDGPLREDTGLLGSPSFEIPRTVARDSRFDRLRTGPEHRRRLAAKNRYNAAVVLELLLVRYLHLLGLGALFGGALHLGVRFGPTAVAAFVVVALFVTVGWFILVERASAGFRPLEPHYCSIYDPYYWWHERYWKLSATAYLAALNGTPFKSWAWRLLGVRVGSRLYDDGCSITERSLVTIGDDCTLNERSVLQGHSMEDAIFKSEPILVGDRCTLGVGAFVHYGTTVGEGAVVAADSFVMKGSDIRPRSHWAGNPAAGTATTGPDGQAAPSDARKAGDGRTS